MKSITISLNPGGPLMMRILKILGLCSLVFLVAGIVLAENIKSENPYYKAISLVGAAKDNLSPQLYRQYKVEIYEAHEKGDLTKINSILDELKPFEAILNQMQDNQPKDMPKLAPQITGGPDKFGYIMIDNISGGPDYAWDDCTGGIQIMIGADDNEVVGPLNMPFQVYGQNITWGAVLSNGALILNDGCPSMQAWQDHCYWGDFELPLGPWHWYYCPPHAMLLTAALTDLDNVTVYVQEFGNLGDQDHRYTTEWQGSHFRWGGYVNFEISMYEDGRIVYQYNTLDLPYNLDQGRYWEVGIQSDMFGDNGFLSYQDCGDANLFEGLDITFMVPQPISCDITTNILNPINTNLPVHTVIAPTVTYTNEGTDDQYDIPVFVELYSETGNLLFTWNATIPYIPSLGFVDWTFTPPYEILEFERNIRLYAGHRQPCDIIMNFPPIKDYYYVNNFDEQIIYMHNNISNDNCDGATDLFIGHWYEMHNFGATNNNELGGVNMVEPFAEVWFKVEAPANGIMTIDFVRPTKEPAIDLGDLYFTALVGTNLLWPGCPDPAKFSDNINPNYGWTIGQYCDPNKEELDVRMLKGQVLYFIIQSSGPWAPEFFWYKLRATFVTFEDAPYYAGNDQCFDAMMVPDNSGPWMIYGSTFGARNDFFFDPYGSICANYSANGFFGPYSDLAMAPDVVYRVPMYEGYEAEFELRPGPSSCLIENAVLQLFDECHAGDSNNNCVAGTYQNIYLNYIAADDNDYWPEERTDHFLIVDGLNWDPYDVRECQSDEGDYELYVNKPTPCTYIDDVKPRLQMDYDYVLNGQTMYLADNSFLDGCKNYGGQDNRLWFVVTEQELLDYFVLIQLEHPEWYGIDISGDEVVWESPDNQVFERNDTLFLSDEFITNFAVVDRYMIIYGPFEESQSVRYTFTENVFVVLGISCRECPGYKYDIQKVTIVPVDPNPKLRVMIVDDQGADMGQRITLTLGETLTMYAWGECAITPNYKNIHYDWYIDTRDGVGPTWVDQEFIKPVPPMGETRYILAGMCIDDPLKGYIEAFDTLIVTVQRAKPPVYTDELAAGEIKVFKSKFAGGSEALSLTYKAFSTEIVSNLKIYDIRNRLVAQLKANVNSDLHSFEWDGKDENGNLLPAGTYIWKLDNINSVKTGVTVLTR
jgi:hypothetical protein